MDRLGDLRPVEQHVQFFLVSHGLSDDSKDVRNFTSPSPLESPEHTLTPVLAGKEPQRSHLVRTALREDLENRLISNCTRKLTVPVLAWGGQAFLGNIAPAWQDVANDVSGGEIERCGHFVAEEKPEFAI